MGRPVHLLPRLCLSMLRGDLYLSFMHITNVEWCKVNTVKLIELLCIDEAFPVYQRNIIGTFVLR
jgi:hypothetical protein